MTGQPEAGDDAPHFALPADGGRVVSLADYRGQALVLFFYPGDDTPTCTEEAVAFSRARAKFRAAGAEILGVSADSVKSHDRFRAKHGLKLRLASDETLAMLNAYGVWGEKTTFGRTYLGIERSTFLIDRQGRVVRVWRKVRGMKAHVAEVLQAAQALAT